MIRIGAKWRINLGMLGLMTSTLLLAVSIGFVPDWRHATLQGRSKLCESLAINSSVLVSRGEKRNLALVFETTVARNNDMLTAAVRDQGGKLVAVVGDHTSRWQDLPKGQATDAQISVPIWNSVTGRQWGTAEFCFRPLVVRGLAALLFSPWTQFVLFVVSANGLLFAWYLGKMLAHMDPNKAVPGRVRSALDTLT
ncbi:MAG: hypothetical protein OES79_16980, partial [Planctomycetota bacterium]|nr:hypothetical protein [Planctomycetota bacterium]